MVESVSTHPTLAQPHPTLAVRRTPARLTIPSVLILRYVANPTIPSLMATMPICLDLLAFEDSFSSKGSWCEVVLPGVWAARRTAGRCVAPRHRKGSERALATSADRHGAKPSDSCATQFLFPLEPSPGTIDAFESEINVLKGGPTEFIFPGARVADH